MARRIRRFWLEEEKRRIVARTYALGVSVSQVGRRYDVNANPNFKWRRHVRYRPSEDGTAGPYFLPVQPVPEPVSAPTSHARVEIALHDGHRVSATRSYDAGTLYRMVRTLDG